MEMFKRKHTVYELADGRRTSSSFSAGDSTRRPGYDADVVVFVVVCHLHGTVGISCFLHSCRQFDQSILCLSHKEYVVEILPSTLGG